MKVSLQAISFYHSIDVNDYMTYTDYMTVDTEAPQVSDVTEEQTPAAVTSDTDHTSSSIHKEASEPAPPTEGVQLDLGISESHHAVAG